VLSAVLGALTLFGNPGGSGTARAQTTPTMGEGFQINRYEPTAAGEWSFAVDHPWYSSIRYFAAGITLNYAHNPLILRSVNPDGSDGPVTSIIEHQLLGHVDLAGSFLDRVLLTASLPVIFLERGTAAAGITPQDGVAVGDPRLGAMIRLFGQPYRSAISMSLGASVWIPLRSITDSLPAQNGDRGVRVLPRLVLGGLAKRFMWSTTFGFYYRPEATIGSTSFTEDGRRMGSEFQIGAALAYADFERRFAIGPEAVMSTIVLNGKPFAADYTSLEVLLGFHYNIKHAVQIGAAAGTGILREPGTPDVRALFRLAYAPMKKPVHDRDGDGVRDEVDLCPDTHKGANPDPDRLGCPLLDRDRDGVFDRDDVCPDTHKGPNPDPERRGCPLGDRDGDQVFDRDDLCPDQHKGPNPDPERRGCPQQDRDGDGVLDRDDLCPEQHKGPKPDPKRNGCPAQDRDGDEVFDYEDQCPEIHKGPKPDTSRPGCPLPDRDKDTVVDPEDACPDKPGAPHPDPKKNGCPGLVVVQNGQLQILKPVFFATNKDVILKGSFPVLEAVGDALKAQTVIKKIRIEGHTDDRGKQEYNIDLSDRRAKSVMRFLIQYGVDPSRLEAKGYGPLRPVADNKTAKGRADNRRVEFHIVDPPEMAGQAKPDEVKAPVSPNQSDGSKGKKPAGKKPAGKKPAKK
jgi:outer membrane protein OmpA-like peptidoglycan-associated protein